MPDRIIRDEMRRSHRYVKQPSDTHRLLFVHLLLEADGFGNCEGTTTALSFIMARPVSDEEAASWLNSLADSDLIRLYENDGKRYIHIPRFRQRLRIRNGKHPRPPKSIECSEINALYPNVRHVSDTRQTSTGNRSPDTPKAPVDNSPESNKNKTINANVRHVSAEVKRSEELRTTKNEFPPPVDNSVHNSRPTTWAEHWTARGKALGIKPNPGESEGDYCRRIQAIGKVKA